MKNKYITLKVYLKNGFKPYIVVLLLQHIATLYMIKDHGTVELEGSFSML